MARKRVYNTNRFDGGMTDSPRDTSNLTKLAYISHLDIYRDPNRMFVMPGYESVNGFDSDDNGIKAYNIKALAEGPLTTRIYALGTKSDGTGSKLFEINDSTQSTTWEVANQTTEGDFNTPARPFLTYEFANFFYPCIDGGNAIRIQKNGFAGLFNIVPASVAVPDVQRYYLVKAFDGNLYSAHPGYLETVRRLTDSAFTNAKSHSGVVDDIATGDYTIAISQGLSRPSRSSLLVWDGGSLLADQNVSMRGGRPAALNNVDNLWILTHERGVFSTAESNGRANFAVSILSGETLVKIWEKECFAGTRYTENEIFSLKNNFGNVALFHARTANDPAKTTYTSGLYAVGRTNPESPYAISILLDTNSLGRINTALCSSNRFYFTHSTDGSISRLQNFDTGTYDVPATIETLIYGADSPYLKELNGISIVTENLPSGGSVVCSYRKDEDDAWTTMGTSDTVGKTKHNFTKVNGTPIGRFQEIQFKIVITGKTAVKNIMVAVTETEDLSF